MLHVVGGRRECQANKLLENSIRPTALGKNELREIGDYTKLDCEERGFFSLAIQYEE